MAGVQIVENISYLAKISFICFRRRNLFDQLRVSPRDDPSGSNRVVQRSEERSSGCNDWPKGQRPSANEDLNNESTTGIGLRRMKPFHHKDPELL